MRYGHIPDTHDARDHVFVGAVSHGPSVTDLRDTDAEIWDQGQVGSCVAQSFCGAVANRAARLGIAVPKPSAMALYAMARLPDGLPLRDDGCRPRMAAKALRTFGLVREERWPYIESRQGVMPPWDVFQHGTEALVSGFQRIASAGQRRIEQIRHALASGYPVPFAQIVDQAFEDYDGSRPLRAFSGAPLGGHMTMIVGVDDARGVFIARNSWGTSWGGRMAGYYEMLYERVVHPTTSDFYVVTLKGDAPHES